MKAACALCFLLAVAVSPLHAALITNGTFDTDYSGWSIQNIDYNGGYRSTGGNPGGMFILNDGPGVFPTISQTVSGLVIGQSYVVTGDYRNVYGCCAPNPSPGAFAVEFDGQIATFDIPVVGSQGGWLPFSHTFTYSGGSSVLYLRAQYNGYDADAAIDNISMALAEGGQQVPEPSTLVMVALAGAAALALRRRTF